MLFSYLIVINILLLITFKLNDVNSDQIVGTSNTYGVDEIVSIYTQCVGVSQRYMLKGDAPVIPLIVICVGI
jgi:hypothetical protein